MDGTCLLKGAVEYRMMILQQVVGVCRIETVCRGICWGPLSPRSSARTVAVLYRMFSAVATLSCFRFEEVICSRTSHRDDKTLQAKGQLHPS